MAGAPSGVHVPEAHSGFWVSTAAAAMSLAADVRRFVADGKLALAGAVA
jgi:hypothetical protein